MRRAQAIVWRRSNPNGGVPEVADARHRPATILGPHAEIDQNVRRFQVGMHQAPCVDVRQAAADALAEHEHERNVEVPTPRRHPCRPMDQVEQRTMQQLGHNVPPAPRPAVRAHADESADVRMPEGGHDVCLLQQLVEPHAVVTEHLLHRHHAVRCRARSAFRGRGRICKLPRHFGQRENTFINHTEAALRDAGLQGEVFQRDDIRPQAGVV
mmetsp:Transcript_71645/g.205579  ORF Transcript_71645/g.205579 Transcript_71645/m.205579 type:complete len:212 (-) Transcript_71645:861-1496(-)